MDAQNSISHAQFSHTVAERSVTAFMHASNATYEHFAQDGDDKTQQERLSTSIYKRIIGVCLHAVASWFSTASRAVFQKNHYARRRPYQLSEVISFEESGILADSVVVVARHWRIWTPQVYRVSGEPRMVEKHGRPQRSPIGRRPP